MKKNKIYLICLIAILASLSVVINSTLTISTFQKKISLYALPLIVAGIIHGPLVGMVTGIIAGTIIQLTSPYGVSLVSIFYGLAPMIWGLVSGFVFKFFKGKGRKKEHIGYVLAIIVASLSANLSNTLAFFMDCLLINDSYYTYSKILIEWPERLITMVITMIPYIFLTSVICTSVSAYLSKDSEKDNVIDYDNASDCKL